jgi:hypothetical protein
LALKLEWRRDNKRCPEHTVQAIQSACDVRTANALGHMSIEIGIAPAIVDKQSLSYVRALHGCSSTGLVST